MANSFSVQILNDGPRNTIAVCTISLDGTQGDYQIPQKLINLPTLSSMGVGFGPHPTRVRVDDLDWDIQNGLSVNLFWEGDGPASIWRMVGRSREKAFHFGGLQNNADQPTGNITFTTTSTTTGAPLFATFRITCVKQA